MLHVLTCYVSERLPKISVQQIDQTRIYPSSENRNEIKFWNLGQIDKLFGGGMQIFAAAACITKNAILNVSYLW